MGKRLYRSKRNRVLFGVCGGFAEYFGIDVTLIRILAIIIACSGFGAFAYIIAAIVMPEEDAAGSSGEWRAEQHDYNTAYTSQYTDNFDKESSGWETKYNTTDERRKFLGAILILVGLVFLLKLIIPAFSFRYLVPLVLIGIGGIIIYKGRK
jgi:phage shock protein C